MRIGTVEIQGRAALAPMAGVADRAFRKICVDYGAGYVVGEMVSCKGLCFQDAKSRELLRLEGEPRDPYQEPLVRAYLLILCSRLLPRMELAPAVKCDTDTLKAVIQYCTENYSREISLQTLSDSLYISKYYISHLFGQRLKVSFCDYINALRVRRACELLRQGGLSVTEVAFAVGYNSTRSFDRCFKKIQKVSPQSYRLRKGSQAVSGDFSNRA